MDGSQETHSLVTHALTVAATRPAVTAASSKHFLGTGTFQHYLIHSTQPSQVPGWGGPDIPQGSGLHAGCVGLPTQEDAASLHLGKRSNLRLRMRLTARGGFHLRKPTGPQAPPSQLSVPVHQGGPRMSIWGGSPVYPSARDQPHTHGRISLDT